MYKLKLSISLDVNKSLGFKNGRFNYGVRDSLEDDIIQLKELGFDCVELLLQPYCPQDLESIAVKAIKICKKHKIKVNSLHMPMSHEWVDFAYPWERDRVEFAKLFNKFLKKIDKYKITSYIFHPGGHYCHKEEDADKFLEYAIDSFNIIADGVKGQVCVENMINSIPIMNSSDKVLKLLNNCKNVKTCVDVNHFLNGEKAEDAILKYGDKVGAIHISDYDYINEKHKMPLDGKIDFMKVIGALEKIGFKNAFNYEVSIGPRYGYTFKDVKENYDKLFEMYNNKWKL